MNVLLLDYVDFLFMDESQGRAFLSKVSRASVDECQRAFALLQKQCGNIMPSDVVTDIAKLLMSRLQIEYSIVRHHLTKKEASTNVNQDRQVDSTKSIVRRNDRAVREGREASGQGVLWSE